MTAKKIKLGDQARAGLLVVAKLLERSETNLGFDVRNGTYAAQSRILGRAGGATSSLIP